MKCRKWVVGTIIAYFAALAGIIGFVVWVDPYFHFHAPFEGMSYVMEEEQYMNDGITRNFTYDAMITGSSISENFSVEEMNELFDVNAVRLTFKGEGYKRVSDNLDVALECNPDLRLVIRGLDTMQYVYDPDYMGYDSYPEYLYDDSIWNDVNYVLNGDVLTDKVIPEAVRTIKEEPAQSFDDYVSSDSGDRETVIRNHARDNWDHMDEDKDRLFEEFSQNLEEHVIKAVEANPEVEFYFFFPPYSICWWDDVQRTGLDTLQWRISLEEAMIERLLPYENVRLFSFNNNFEMICDLNNYFDSVHYTEEVGDRVLEWMKNADYELTEENYESYIRGITEFYVNFDYDSFFEKLQGEM